MVLLSELEKDLTEKCELDVGGTGRRPIPRRVWIDSVKDTVCKGHVYPESKKSEWHNIYGRVGGFNMLLTWLSCIHLKHL